jgi:hypothetical protein
MFHKVKVRRGEWEWQGHWIKDTASGVGLGGNRILFGKGRQGQVKYRVCGAPL